MENFTEQENVFNTENHCHDVSIIAWPGIIAGGLVAIGVSFLFNLLSAGLGFSAFTLDTQGLAVLAIGGVIWLLIGAVVTMFITGWVAGRVASYNSLNLRSGSLHGFLAWCVGLILMLLLVSRLSFVMVSGGQFLANNTQAPAYVNSAAQSLALTTVTKQNDVITPQTQITPAAVEKAAQAAAIVALVHFCVFLLGAISSCLGGVMGIRHQPDRLNRRH